MNQLQTTYYENPGVYQVELAVQDQFGKWSDSIFGVVTVTPNVAPTAIITMVDDPAGNRFKKLFSASQSSDPDGSISNYFWYVFGSGVFATGVNTEFTFPGPGTYTMGLDVFDDKGARTSASFLVEIPQNAPPVAKIRITNIDHQTRTVSFTAEDSTHDSLSLTYAWDFGDGETSDVVSPVHVYQTDGEQLVNLKVTDSLGQESVAFVQPLISQTPVRMVAEYEAGALLTSAADGDTLYLPTLPASVEFKLKSGEYYVDSRTVSWTTSDGFTEVGPNFTYKYFEAGAHAVTATFQDELGISRTKTVTISHREDACIRSETDSNCALVLSATKGTHSIANPLIQVKIKDSETTGLGTAEMEFTQSGFEKIFDQLDIQNGVVALPTNVLLQTAFDPNLPFQIRVSALVGQEMVGATAPDQVFRTSRVVLKKGGAIPDISLLITESENRISKTLTLTDTPLEIDDLPNSLIRVSGTQSGKTVTGLVSARNDITETYLISPKSSVEDPENTSVIFEDIPAASFSTSSANKMNSMSIQSESITTLNTNPNECLTNGKPCFISQFQSPFSTLFANGLYQSTLKESDNLGTDGTGGTLYKQGVQTVSDENFIRSIDDRFNVRPGERYELECKGHTTRWNSEVLDMPSAETINSYESRQGDAFTAVAALYSVFPEEVREVCGMEAPANCVDLNGQNGGTVSQYRQQWDQFVIGRAPYLADLHVWDNYSASINYDSGKLKASEIGKLSAHQVFTVTATFIRLNSSGSDYLSVNQSNSKVTLKMTYNTAKMRGQFTVADVSKSYQSPFQNGSDLKSKSIFGSVLIPSDWLNYRTEVKITTTEKYKTKLVRLPGLEGRISTASSFACRPVYITPVANIISAAADPNDVNLLKSVPTSFPVEVEKWTNEIGNQEMTKLSWDNFSAQTVVRQQGLLESRSFLNPDATLNPTPLIPSILVRTIGTAAFEKYKTESTFANPSANALFPMELDRDTSNQRNPAFSPLLMNASNQLDPLQIGESNFGIKAKFKVGTRRIRSIENVFLTINGTTITSLLNSPVPVNRQKTFYDLPVVNIPYTSIKSNLPGSSLVQGEKFEIGFSVSYVDIAGNTGQSTSPLTISMLPVWNLKNDVPDSRYSPPISDAAKGTYSNYISAYGSKKLKDYLQKLLEIRTAKSGIPEESFNVYINDGSLPFGSSFKPAHKSHDNGNILDLRPIGNTGQTPEHYDFGKGEARLKDYATLWAHSTYLTVKCGSFQLGSEQRSTCENQFTSIFAINLSVGSTQDELVKTRNRIVKWVNQNGAVFSAISPSSIGASAISYYFSRGAARFSPTCEHMKNTYIFVTNESAPADSCQTTYDGTAWTFQLTQIQIQLLRDGQLPDKRSIPGLIIDSNFRNIYLQFLRNSEIEHFDHFHLEVTN